jgi:hypothetical protein
MRTKYTFGPEMVTDSALTTEIVRGPLTHNIQPLFSELYDEVASACQEYMPARKGAFVSSLCVHMLIFHRMEQGPIHEYIASDYLQGEQ